MKKLAIASALTLAVCATPLTAMAETIAVSMAYFDQNFLTLIRTAIADEAAKQGVTVHFEDAQGDVGRQLNQLESFVAEGVDAVIIDPVDSASTPKMTKMAQEAGVPLVYVNRKPGDKQLQQGTVFVGSNELESGTMQMEELARLANYQGNVAIMIGNLSDEGALIRTKDVEDVVAKYPKMKVVEKQVANYDRTEAMDLMTNWLTTGTPIDIVAANNDEMAIGAILALQQSGKDPHKVLIGGIDATPDGLSAMTKDGLDVTVFQDAKGQGRGALNAALSMARGNKLDSYQWIPFELVTPQNMQQYQ